jgi:hypothetical protein
MRAIFLLLLLMVNLIADTKYYYTKQIIFDKITKSTLVRVKIDNELYSKMISDDIRVYSSDDRVENHYIKSNPPTLQSYSSDDGYDIVTIPLLLKSIELNYTDYIFKLNGTPADRIIANIKEKEYNRVAKIYVGNSQKEWHFILKYLFQKVKFSEIEDREIALNTSTKFIRLRVSNINKEPLTIESLKVKTAPNYLYFIAKPNQEYNIHFTKIHSKNSNMSVAKSIELNEPFIEGKLADLKKNQIVEIPKDSSEKSTEKKFVIAIVIAVVVLFSIAIGLIKGKDN